MQKKSPTAAFTLLELIMVMSIILVLAAGALAGSAQLFQSIRLSNAAQKLVSMVQQARAQAKAHAEENVQSYGVLFTVAREPLHSATFFANLDTVNPSFTTPPDTRIEGYKLDTALFEMRASDELDRECADALLIVYTVEEAATRLYCNGDIIPRPFVKLQLLDKKSGRLQAVFSLHTASGIPQ